MQYGFESAIEIIFLIMCNNYYDADLRFIL